LSTTYREGKPHRTEADLDGDGSPDLMIEYQNGRKAVQREDRNSNGKFDLVTYFDESENPKRIEDDTDHDGRFETVTFYKGGEKVRAEKDRNGDRKPDVFIYFEGDQIARQEEDTDFDGVVDVRNRAGAKGERIQEADTNSDGKVDTWLTSDADGNVVKKKEDQSGDGKPDLIVFFKNGKVDRLEQDTDAGGCTDLKQWFSSAGKVRAEYRDSTGDCKTDIWNYFEKDVLVRQGQDTLGKGRPQVLNHFDSNGALTVQEAVGEGGRNPDKKLFLNASGEVIAQCLLDAEGKKLNVRTIVVGGVVVEALIDTTGNGVADNREVYEGGERVRMDVDTNNDRKPDVTITAGPGGVSRQDEDTDFDGIVDLRFDGDTPVDIPAGTKLAGEKFGKLDCGSFHRFWWKR
jgi:antitoxin component YwqK of YwqJK toxin-antitoxin module